MRRLDDASSVADLRTWRLARRPSLPGHPLRRASRSSNMNRWLSSTTLIGRPRLPTDGCRRYRVTAVTFDTRPVRPGHGDRRFLGGRRRARSSGRRAKRRHSRACSLRVRCRGLRPETRWTSSRLAPSRGRLWRQSEPSGDPKRLRGCAYYPALLGAVGLGERILNQVILERRDALADHPATKPVATNKAFDDWKPMIRVLKTWQVLPDDVATNFERLRRLRHDAVHRNVPTSTRPPATRLSNRSSCSSEPSLLPSKPDPHLIPGIAGADI